jgi:hypothetical protein
MKTKALTAAITILIFFLQTPTLELGLSRDWGYGGPNGRIQGLFSMRAEGPEDLVEVRFRLDEAVVSLDTEAPFRFQFQTDNYPPGVHTLSASGTLASGEVIESREIVQTFLSTEEAGADTRALILPLLAVGAVIVLLGVGAPLLLSRGKVHKPGVYGMAGGAVCKRCGMPFSRSILAPNMIVGKLERCPHCGKWAIVGRAAAADLAAAEDRLAGEGHMEGGEAETEAEKRERLLNESRFDN